MKKSLLFLILILPVIVFSQGYGCKQDLFPVRDSNKKMFGYVNLLGDWVITPFYDFARPFKEGIAVVGKHSEFGLIDCNGKRVLPIEYEEIKDFVNGYAWVKKQGLWGFVDQKGVLVLECKYQEVEDVSRFDDLAWVKTKDKWGVFNKEKAEFIHEPKFDSYYQLSSDYSLVELNGLKGMLLHKKKEMVLEIKYNSIDKFAPYLLSLKKGDNYGVVRDNGKLLLKAEYSSIKNLGIGRFSVQKNNKFAVYDLWGKRIVPFVLDSVTAFHNNAALVKIEDKYSFINPKGRRLFGETYSKAFPFNNKIAIVQSDEGFKLINRKGDKVSPFFEEMLDFGDYVSAKKGENWKVLLKDRPNLESFDFKNIYGGIPSIIQVETKQGQMFYNAYEVNYYSPKVFDEIGQWYNGFIKVKQKGMYGYLDSNLREVIKPQYETLNKITKYSKTYFVGENKGKKYVHSSKGKKLVSDGYKTVKIAGNYFVVCNENCGVFDNKNSQVIDTKYNAIEIADSIDLKYASYFIGQSKGKYCIIDKAGNQIVKPKYNLITYLGSGYFSLLSKGKYSVIDRKGTVLIQSFDNKIVRYDKVGVFVFEKEGKLGLLNKKGEIKSKAVYNQIQEFIGVYAVVKKEMYGLIGKSGKLKEKCIYIQVNINENGSYTTLEASLTETMLKVE